MFRTEIVERPDGTFYIRKRRNTNIIKRLEFHFLPSLLAMILLRFCADPAYYEIPCAIPRKRIMRASKCSPPLRTYLANGTTRSERRPNKMRFGHILACCESARGSAQRVVQLKYNTWSSVHNVSYVVRSSALTPINNIAVVFASFASRRELHTREPNELTTHTASSVLRRSTLVRSC